MGNSFTLAQSYFNDPANLAAVAKQVSVTTDLDTPSERVKFIGTNKALVKRISFANAPSAIDRTGTLTANDTTVDWDTLTLDYMKGNQLPLGKFDLEETGTNAIEVGNAYKRLQQVPARDTYRLAKLVATASIGAKTGSAALTKDTIEGEIDIGIAAVKDAEIGIEGSILYMDSAYYGLLIDSSKSTHNITYGVFNGEVNKDISFYRHCKIVEVPSGRWPSGKGFILVQPKAQMSVIKDDETTLYEKVPGKVGSQLDAYEYGGTMVYANAVKGIYCYTKFAG